MQERSESARLDLLRCVYCVDAQRIVNPRSERGPGVQI